MNSPNKIEITDKYFRRELRPQSLVGIWLEFEVKGELQVHMDPLIWLTHWIISREGEAGVEGACITRFVLRKGEKRLNDARIYRMTELTIRWSVVNILLSRTVQPGFHTPTPNIRNITQQPFLRHATKCAGFQSTVIFGILFFNNLKIKLVSLRMLIEIVNTYSIVFLS